MARPTLARTCCTTPSAMCFFAAVFLVLYGVGLFLGTVWPALQQYDQTLILAALGVACFINFGRNRTLHCAITGPVFLLSALVATLAEAGIWSVNPTALWGLVLAAVGLAFLVEWRTVGGRQRAANA